LRIPILDLDDPRIAIYRSLKATNQTRRLRQFVVEGEKLVHRLAESRFPVVSVLATERQEASLPLAAIRPEVPRYIVPDQLIDDLVGYRFHRGLLACAERRPWPALGELLSRSGSALTFVICPKLSDPQNLGTIARVGDLFGIDAILSGPECPDPFSRRVLRVSMGAVLRLPVIGSPDLHALADQLVEEGQVDLWAAVAEPEAIPFDRLTRPRRVALVLGEEDRGLAPDWLARCQQAVTIPMRPGASSLNVAVAAGILIYGLSRRS
jgi:tRNA G18 (ribose-2'-O)-methylase SpoU